MWTCPSFRYEYPGQLTEGGVFARTHTHTHTTHTHARTHTHTHTHTHFVQTSNIHVHQYMCTHHTSAHTMIICIHVRTCTCTCTYMYILYVLSRTDLIPPPPLLPPSGDPPGATSPLQRLVLLLLPAESGGVRARGHPDRHHRTGLFLHLPVVLHQGCQWGHHPQDQGALLLLPMLRGGVPGAYVRGYFTRCSCMWGTTVRAGSLAS